MRLTRLLPLLAVAGGLLASAAPAQTFGSAGRSGRANQWEFYAGLRPLLSENVDFEGGTTVDTDDDLGFAFGFGYNTSDHLQFSGELSWNRVDYDAKVAAADGSGNTVSASGEFDTLGISAIGTWHFLDGPLTPYASAILGYTWVDSNIADGPPVTGCWWDPWWGYVCSNYWDTKSDEAVNYGLAAGVRWEPGPGWFLRFGYEENWINLDKASGTPHFGSFALDVGSRF